MNSALPRGDPLKFVNQPVCRSVGEASVPPAELAAGENMKRSVALPRPIGSSASFFSSKTVLTPTLATSRRFWRDVTVTDSEI